MAAGKSEGGANDEIPGLCVRDWLRRCLLFDRYDGGLGNRKRLRDRGAAMKADRAIEDSQDAATILIAMLLVLFGLVCCFY